jgi:hypothetical protein
MPSENETCLYYRGCYIESRFCDGTETVPTWATGPMVWVVFRTGDAGVYEELGVVHSERAARHLVDELAGRK